MYAISNHYGSMGGGQVIILLMSRYFAFLNNQLSSAYLFKVNIYDYYLCSYKKTVSGTILMIAMFPLLLRMR